MRRAVAIRLLSASVALSAASSASADTSKQACVAANTSGQDLRRDSKLAAAREKLVACTDPSCPALVRDDCTRRLDEIERVQPTIVWDVKDPSGHDVSSARVSVDGHLLSERLTGAPIRVDPGEHTFVFEVSGQPAVHASFVIKEGEKDRRERIVVGEQPPASPPAAAPPSPPAPVSPVASTPETVAVGRDHGPATAVPTQPQSTDVGSSRRVVGLALGGGGVVAAAVGAAFGFMTIGRTNQQKTDCATATSCQDHGSAVSDHSAATTDGAISTVAFVGGGILLAAGAALFFTAPSSSEHPAASVRLLPAMGSGGGGLTLSGKF